MLAHVARDVIGIVKAIVFGLGMLASGVLYYCAPVLLCARRRELHVLQPYLWRHRRRHGPHVVVSRSEPRRTRRRRVERPNRPCRPAVRSRARRKRARKTGRRRVARRNSVSGKIG